MQALSEYIQEKLVVNKNFNDITNDVINDKIMSLIKELKPDGEGINYLISPIEREIGNDVTLKNNKSESYIIYSLEKYSDCCYCKSEITQTFNGKINHETLEKILHELNKHNELCELKYYRKSNRVYYPIQWVEVKLKDCILHLFGDKLFSNKRNRFFDNPSQFTCFIGYNKND